MEIVLLIILNVLCFYGFIEQEKNMKTLGEMIEKLEGAKNAEQSNRPDSGE